MKITRRQLRRLIKEAIAQGGDDPIEKGIGSDYRDLYQIEVDDKGIVSVAVRDSVNTVMSNEELLSFMAKFDLELAKEEPFRVKAQEPPMRPEFTLEADDHTRVYFEDSDEDLEAGFDDYDEEPSGFANSRFIQDPRRPDRGDYY